MMFRSVSLILTPFFQHGPFKQSISRWRFGSCFPRGARDKASFCVFVRVYHGCSKTLGCVSGTVFFCFVLRFGCKIVICCFSIQQAFSDDECRTRAGPDMLALPSWLAVTGNSGYVTDMLELLCHAFCCQSFVSTVVHICPTVCSSSICCVVVAAAAVLWQSVARINAAKFTPPVQPNHES